MMRKKDGRRDVSCRHYLQDSVNARFGCIDKIIENVQSVATYVRDIAYTVNWIQDGEI